MRRYSAAVVSPDSAPERIPEGTFRGRSGALAFMVVIVGMAVSVFVTLSMMMIVGAAFGIKRRFDRRQPCAEPAQHIFDNVIAPDAQSLADDLDVDVTIADMPREACQIVSIRSGDFIEQEFRAAFAAQHDAAAMAVMRVERDRVDGLRLIPMSGGFDVACALHG